MRGTPDKYGVFSSIAQVLSDADIEMRPREFALLVAGAGVAFGALAAVFTIALDAPGLAGAVFLSAFLLSEAAAYILVIYLGYARLKAIEELLPDFLSLMASNIRSGLTPDRAMLMSARKEFGPLSKVVDKAAKEAMTGTPIDKALLEMTESARSEIFTKSIRLIVEGIRSGGELHELLENTSLDMRRFSYLRKEVASTVLVYELFMFSASAFGAPVLYGVTNFLLAVMSSLRSKMSFDPSALGNSMMVGSNDIQLDPAAVYVFSLLAISTTVLFSCLASGIITKGKPIAGAKYFPPLIIIAFIVFFGTMSILQLLFSKVFRF